MTEPQNQIFRCAIYTRKSSDEGLEQAHNSLDAQRAACEAYIASQQHEGWRLVPAAYDDGGFSGGDMNRPGLKALLADIKAGLIDVVVVYKIDRLTRALLDFAKIVEALDASEASFVAVTQAFNTTTSMGRLTLNILLSFAQFEREITGERIRDKFASTRAKGIWVGSKPPLGYDRKDGLLAINPAEGAVVQAIFREYLKRKSITAVVAYCDANGLRTKAVIGGTGSPISHSSVVNVLSNPVYIGKIRHQGVVLEGRHPPIISPDDFTKSEALLSANRQAMAARRCVPPVYLLEGLLRSADGEAFEGCRGEGRSYHKLAYKLPEGGSARAKRVNAATLDTMVLEAVRGFLQALAATCSPEAAEGLAGSAAALRSRKLLQLKAELAAIVDRVEIDGTNLRITVRLRASGLEGALSRDTDVEAGAIRRITPSGNVVLADGSEGGVDMPMVKLIGRGARWFNEILSGRNVTVADIARREGFSACYVGTTMEFAFLAPDLKQAILEGRHPRGLTARLLQSLSPLPSSWERQRELVSAVAGMTQPLDRKALHLMKGPMIRRPVPWCETGGPWATSLADTREAHSASALPLGEKLEQKSPDSQREADR